MAPPRKVIHTEAQWLQQRREVITATEASTLLGLDRWNSPAKVMAEKQQSTFTGNAYTFIGNLLEPVVIEATNHLLGTQYRSFSSENGKTFYTHPTLKLGATPDAGDEVSFLECKTTKPMNYLRYAAAPPKHYVMQLMTQLFCAELDFGYLSIMSTDLTQTSEVLNLPLSIYKVNRCPKLCALLEQELNRFWTLQEEKKLFRVNSKVKTQAQLLIGMSYAKVI